MDMNKIFVEFLEVMKAKYNKHPERPGFLAERTEYLLVRCAQEVGELIDAVFTRQGSEAVRREAADVANIAMGVALAYQRDDKHRARNFNDDSQEMRE